jgi:carboxymethylenebutenolidase
MGYVTIQTDSGKIQAFLGEPADSDQVPGVVVVHEALGLTDDIKAYCNRFAEEGYLALAPNLFSRGSKFRCLIETFRSLNRGEGRAFDDIEAARRHLVEHPRCTGRVGVIGFCMGGGFALLMAPRDVFNVAAVKYGRLPEDAEQILPGSCPIVASYGDQDFTIRGGAERLERVLTALDVPHDVKEYSGASHSFMNRHTGGMHLLGRVTGFGYHQSSAEDAWRRVLTMFSEYLAPTAAQS